MGQAQINVRTRACSRTSIARTKQAALTHNVRGKELNGYLEVSAIFNVSSVIRRSMFSVFTESRHAERRGQSVGCQGDDCADVEDV